MRRKCKRLSNSNEQGAILILLAFAIIPIIMLVAFAVDGFFILAHSMQRKHNADYAAIAFFKSNSTGVANTVAQKNKYVLQGGTDNSVTIKGLGPNSSGESVYKFSMSQSEMPSIFAGIFGINKMKTRTDTGEIKGHKSGGAIVLER